MENLDKILPEGFDINSEYEKHNEKRKKHLEELNDEQKSKLGELKEVQKEVDGLEEAEEEEYKAIEQKYKKLMEPVFEKRTALINGDSKDDAIPDFWLYAIKNSDIFEELNEKDEDSLKYLTNVTSTDFSGEDGEGYILEFHYRENPYFGNKVLSKKFYTEQEEEGNSRPAVGTEIEWKEDKDLTSTFETKKKKHKGGGKPKIVKKKVPCASFYNFFSSISEEELDGIEDEEEAQAVEEELYQEQQIGEVVRDNLIPNAVGYFTGEIESLNPLSQMFSGLGGDHVHGPNCDHDHDDEDEDEEGGVKQIGGQKGDNKECENQQQ
jgi:nucleosome assembly protein 1-like 1